MEMIYLSVNYILLGEESVFQKIVLLKIKLGFNPSGWISFRLFKIKSYWLQPQLRK
jgi:hypothetical protein